MGIHEECGLFGIYDGSASANVALSTYYGLYALQHRGQESCGITVNDDGILTSYKDVGLAMKFLTRTGCSRWGRARWQSAMSVIRATALPTV